GFLLAGPVVKGLVSTRQGVFGRLVQRDAVRRGGGRLERPVGPAVRHVPPVLARSLARVPARARHQRRRHPKDEKPGARHPAPPQSSTATAPFARRSAHARAVSAKPSGLRTTMANTSSVVPGAMGSALLPG